MGNMISENHCGANFTYKIWVKDGLHHKFGALDNGE